MVASYVIDCISIYRQGKVSEAPLGVDFHARFVAPAAAYRPRGTNDKPFYRRPARSQNVLDQLARWPVFG